ncbi:MAG: (Fe-S)-binding protein [bacterium]|jgi:Fe-S oxidoreductase|nr:(Fe-S)-binding protein [candidate division KSB1 bacterium]MDH7559217.1 (Fe-S)-binding protein [bacterium]
MPRPIVPIPEIREAILEQGGQEAYKCYQCGKCMSACPWFAVQLTNYPVYRYPQAVKLGSVTATEDKEELAAEMVDIFCCLGCEACRKSCLRGLDMPVVLRAVRRVLADFGSVPQEIRAAMSKVGSSGNPLGEPPERRALRAQELTISAFSPELEWLYFPCCVPAYNQRAQSMAKATASILRRAGISFGILGQKESCCGESMRKVGAEKLFWELAEANLTAFGAAGVRRIVVSSPHCLAAFSADYGERDGHLAVVHETQLFAHLISQRRIVPQKQTPRVVTYHDPCLLGRKQGIYDEPRSVLRSIPGLRLVEIENFSRDQSICCGGGGGGLWLDWPVEERVTNVRILQAARTGADTLAIARPYCLQMFEDATKVLNLRLEVKAVSELLSEAL